MIKNGILENLKNQDMIEKRMFTMYLDNNAESFGDSFSEVIINGIDEKYYLGNFTYLPLVENTSMWNIHLNSVHLNSTPI